MCMDTQAVLCTERPRNGTGEEEQEKEREKERLRDGKKPAQSLVCI